LFLRDRINVQFQPWTLQRPNYDEEETPIIKTQIPGREREEREVAK
jgi:hypothetical protein